MNKHIESIRKKLSSSLKVSKKSFEYLKSINEKGNGGLVFLGAGGEAQEWINGVTEYFIKEKVLPKGTLPTDWIGEAFFLTGNVAGEDGRTDLVFTFAEEAKISIGRLAIVRLQMGGCSWIEDFVVNYCEDYGESRPDSYGDVDDYYED